MTRKSLTPDSTVTPVVSSVRNYPEALCRKQKSKNGRNSFYSVSFMFKDAWSTFIMNNNDVTPSKRQDGELNPRHFDLSLGAPDGVRFVSIKTGEDSYKRQAMFNETIVQAIAESHNAWLKSIAI